MLSLAITHMPFTQGVPRTAHCSQSAAKTLEAAAVGEHSPQDHQLREHCCAARCGSLAPSWSPRAAGPSRLTQARRDREKDLVSECCKNKEEKKRPTYREECLARAHSLCCSWRSAWRPPTAKGYVFALRIEPRESFCREKVALVLGARGVAVRADASRASGGGASYHMPGNESTAGRGAWQ